MGRPQGIEPRFQAPMIIDQHRPSKFVGGKIRGSNEGLSPRQASKAWTYPCLDKGPRSGPPNYCGQVNRLRSSFRVITVGTRPAKLLRLKEHPTQMIRFVREPSPGGGKFKKPHTFEWCPAGHSTLAHPYPTQDRRGCQGLPGPLPSGPSSPPRSRLPAAS